MSPSTLPRLYVLPGSHACRSAILMLEHKRVDHVRVSIPAGLHPLLARGLGFEGWTVPALRTAEGDVQGNKAIARYLDRRQPTPALLPADPSRRQAVERAENWGDEELQMVARRLALADFIHHSPAEVARINGPGAGPLGVIFSPDPKRSLMTAKLGARFLFDANPETERELLRELPPMLDRIDRWIDQGTLGAAETNVADLLIAPSLALLTYRSDLRPEIEARPCGKLVRRYLPWPGYSTHPDGAPAGGAARLRSATVAGGAGGGRARHPRARSAHRRAGEAAARGGALAGWLTAPRPAQPRRGADGAGRGRQAHTGALRSRRAARGALIATFALIPGAGADPRVYGETIVALHDLGHRALAPPLPLADEDGRPSDHADAVADAVAGESDLVVVAQSLGAFTGPLVAARIPVRQLILLAPMIPRPGETAGEWWENTGHEAAIADVLDRHGPMRTWGREAIADVFLHDVDPAVAREGERFDREPGAGMFGEPWPLDAWPDVPTRVLAPRDDRLFPLDFQRRLTAQRLGREIDEINGGHLPMLSRPSELAARLVGLAATE